MTTLKTTQTRLGRTVTAAKVKAVRHAAAIPGFDAMPGSALVRQSQLIRDPKNPTRPAPLPFSPSTLWRRVRDGSFPQPVKLGERFTCWKVCDVRAWMKAQNVEAAQP